MIRKLPYKYKIPKYYLKGIGMYLPGVLSNLLPRHMHQFYGNNVKLKGYDPVRATYCTWLRLLVYLRNNHIDFKLGTVAEIGPGDSLGVGISALLCGADNYYAFDVMRYAYTNSNIQVFEDLILQFNGRKDIPNEQENPKAMPRLTDYSFPVDILSNELLAASLGGERLKKIRNDIIGLEQNQENQQADSCVKFFTPWYKKEIMIQAQVDLLFSGAVMEHVDNLEDAYKASGVWVKRGGIVAHNIDFRSHETHPLWNGYFEYSDFEWSIIKGRTPYLINRAPLSRHVELLEENGFEIIHLDKLSEENLIPKRRLAKKFRNISDDDLTCKWAMVVARKL